ncbi:VIT1/CCC1 transporter family protein, partial [Candidatus Bathyarchaeota archaeon]|nr:VIT1/CCC1 transporter family protein [Candidatus Bathyarchaeota archaeon]
MFSASYVESRAETEAQIGADPLTVRSNIRGVFSAYDLPPPALNTLVDHLSSSPNLADFLMKFHHCALEPPSNRAFTSALTIALGYFLGGFVPLLPYFFA